MSLSYTELESFYHQLADLLQAGTNLPHALEQLSGRIDGIDPADVRELQGLLERGHFESVFEEIGLPARDAVLLKQGQKAGGLRDMVLGLADIYETWNELKMEGAKGLAWVFGAGLLLILVVMVYGVIQGAAGVGFGTVITVIGVWFGFLCYVGWEFNRVIAGERPGLIIGILSFIPPVYAILRELELFLIYRQWKLLYKAGVSIDRVIASLVDTMGDPPDELTAIPEKLASGQRLSDLTELNEWLPSRDYGELCTGEQSGTIDESLARLEDRHRSEFVERLESLPRYLLFLVIIIYAVYFILGLSMVGSIA